MHCSSPLRGHLAPRRHCSSPRRVRACFKATWRLESTFEITARKMRGTVLLRSVLPCSVPLYSVHGYARVRTSIYIYIYIYPPAPACQGPSGCGGRRSCLLVTDPTGLLQTGQQTLGPRVAGCWSAVSGLLVSWLGPPNRLLTTNPRATQHSGPPPPRRRSLWPASQQPASKCIPYAAKCSPCAAKCSPYAAKYSPYGPQYSPYAAKCSPYAAT